MKNALLLLVTSFLFLTGCRFSIFSNDADNSMKGNKPPVAEVEVGSKTYDTVLGSYCWSSKGSSECVDTGGPIELLEGKTPINVSPGEVIKFVMDYDPKPNEIHAVQMTENGEEMGIKPEDNTFFAPEKSGIYYFSYGVWWMDENKENVSNGSAFYSFALEVTADAGTSENES